MKNIPLRDLDWFSFGSELENLNHLSLFQAIAYIMRNESSLISLGKEYESVITKREISSAQEVYDHYRITTDQYPADTIIKEFDYRNICIPENEILGDDNLTTLYYWRMGLTEQMDVPVSVIDSALRSEIEKYRSNEKTSLEIITKPIGGQDEFYFNRENLKNWKSLSKIKQLGLLNTNLKRTKNPSEINLEKHQKYIGMLIHLLAHQSLYVDKANVKFIKSSDVRKINYHKIYDFFNNNFLDEDKSDERNFPMEHTVTDDLKAAYQFFIEEVHPQKKTSI